nr:hypothetical protein Itr_chr11CG13650 [Ipomoea trifida]
MLVPAATTSISSFSSSCSSSSSKTETSRRFFADFISSQSFSSSSAMTNLRRRWTLFTALSSSPLSSISTDLHREPPLMSTVLLLSPTLSMDLLQGLWLKTVNSGLASTLLAIFTDLLRELLLAMEGKNLSNIVVDSVKATERSIS